MLRVSTVLVSSGLVAPARVGFRHADHGQKFRVRACEMSVLRCFGIWCQIKNPRPLLYLCPILGFGTASWECTTYDCGSLETCFD